VREVATALACGLLLLGSSAQVHADESDLVEASATIKKQVFADMTIPWNPDQRCTSVALAKSNHRWALMSTSKYGWDHCGPSSGHSRVIKKTAKGWTYLFYDMENDGCTRFHVPMSVRHDFAPYVC